MSKTLRCPLAKTRRDSTTLHVYNPCNLSNRHVHQHSRILKLVLNILLPRLLHHVVQIVPYRIRVITHRARPRRILVDPSNIPRRRLYPRINHLEPLVMGVWIPINPQSTLGLIALPTLLAAHVVAVVMHDAIDVVGSFSVQCVAVVLFPTVGLHVRGAGEAVLFGELDVGAELGRGQAGIVDASGGDGVVVVGEFSAIVADVKVSIASLMLVCHVCDIG
jgi:hypothetical protein